MAFVLDNSVLLGWFVPTQDSSYTRRIAQRAKREEPIVPALWEIEFANAMIVLKRREVLAPHAVADKTGQRRAGCVDPHERRPDETELHVVKAEFVFQFGEHRVDRLPVGIIEKANGPQHDDDPPFVSRRGRVCRRNGDLWRFQQRWALHHLALTEQSATAPTCFVLRQNRV